MTENQANIHKIPPGKVRWTAATSEVTLAAERGGGVWRGGAVLLKVATFTDIIISLAELSVLLVLLVLLKVASFADNLKKFIFVMKY